VPFGRLLGTLGGHIESHSVVLFGSPIAVVRHGSGSFDLSSLSGAFSGILDVRLMLGELIVSDRGVRSLALLRVCLLIHLFVCLFVIILHSAAGGHGISRTYFLPASSVT